MYSSRTATLCTKTVVKGVVSEKGMLTPIFCRSYLAPHPFLNIPGFADQLRPDVRRSRFARRIAGSRGAGPTAMDAGTRCRQPSRDHLRCICIGMTREGVNVPCASVGPGDIHCADEGDIGCPHGPRPAAQSTRLILRRGLQVILERCQEPRGTYMASFRCDGGTRRSGIEGGQRSAAKRSLAFD